MNTPTRPAAAKMTTERLATIDPYDRVADPCPDCHHPWHGFPCRTLTLRMDKPVCECPGPWGYPE